MHSGLSLPDHLPSAGIRCRLVFADVFLPFLHNATFMRWFGELDLTNRSTETCDVVWFYAISN